MEIVINAETIYEIKQVLEANPEEKKIIRIFVAGFDHHGPDFGLMLDDKKEGDLFYEEDQLAFVMEQKLYLRYGDIRIEYVDGGYLVQPAETFGDGTCSSCNICGSDPTKQLASAVFRDKTSSKG